MKLACKKYRFGYILKLVKILPLLAAWSTVICISGCVRNVEDSAPPSAIPKADGVASAGKFRAVAIEDMDNDGKLDIVGGASSPGMIAINYGDGKGGISKPQNVTVVGDVRSVAVADINEDGLPDIVFSVQKESSGIRVLLNQSKRQWKLEKGPVEINKYEGIKTADINGDGHFDIIAANATSTTQGGVQVWLGDGKGNWPIESGPTISGIYMDVLVADLNQDGNLDLIGSGWGTHGALRIWLGDGTGNWSSTNPLEKGNYYGLSIGDLNSDGHFDIFAGSHRKGARIFLGDGLGGFHRIFSPAEVLERRVKVQAKTAAGVGELPPPEKHRSFWQVLALDLDKDGRDDILAGSLDSQGVRAWRNLGNKGWKTMDDVFPSNGTYYGMAIADLDEDERMDICAASFGEGIKIWSGKDGGFKIDQQQIEQLKSPDSRKYSTAPFENDVYKTIEGRDEYKIDPGDILEVTFWEGTAAQKEEILVRSDGKISFGFVEDLDIKGLTASELDRKLTQYLNEYVKNPRIDVVVKKYNSKFVQVVGAVQSHGQGTGSGKYHLKGKSTVLEIISQAGGPSRDANLNDVRIRRKSGQMVSINLFKTINQGDLSQDLVVNDGDVVFIPTLAEKGNRVYVFGEVEKPGAYTFTGSNFRLIDAISEAGGSTLFASPESTRVVRGDPTRPEFIDVNLKSLIEEGDQSQNMVLASGDLVYVPRSGWGDINFVNQRVRPLLELLLWPARTIIDWHNAADIIKSGGSSND
ncbi:MAG: VCBS repeat-containing protein [Desulfobacterales bacterium]|nr:MAG: VCBS repeat-containing protein [Desulfobacterales bacterium]